MKAEIEKLIEQLSLLTACTAKLVETLVNLKEVELSERQNDLGKDKPLVGFSSHQIRAEENTTKSDEPAEDPSQAQDDDDHRFVTCNEASELLGRTGSALYQAAKGGKIPSIRYTEEGKPHYRIDVAAITDKEDIYRPFELEVGMSRTKDDKAHSIATSRVMEIKDRLPLDFVIGVKPATMRQRLYEASNKGLLKTYRLGGTEFVNIDELRAFALWWVENYHCRYKSELRGHDTAFSDFCVHENDLVWLQTRRFNDRLYPSRELLARNVTEYGKYSVVVRGIRYYNRIVLNMV